MESECNSSDHTWNQEQDGPISDLSMYSITRVSLAQFRILKMMKTPNKTAPRLWKYIPFIQVLPGLFFQGQLQQFSDRAEEAHRQRLRNNVSMEF